MIHAQATPTIPSVRQAFSPRKINLVGRYRAQGRHDLEICEERIMSVSGISAGLNGTYQPSNSQSEFRQDFGQLAGALNSGNLAGAQQAYSALSGLQNSGQGPNANSPLSAVLGEIGQALQNNNLAGAQQALSSLQQPQGNHHHHHGHHHATSDSSVTTSAAAANSDSTSTSSASSSGSSLNVTA